MIMFKLNSYNVSVLKTLVSSIQHAHTVKQVGYVLDNYSSITSVDFTSLLGFVIGIDFHDMFAEAMPSDLSDNLDFQNYEKKLLNYSVLNLDDCHEALNDIDSEYYPKPMTLKAIQKQAQKVLDTVESGKTIKRATNFPVYD